MSTDENITKRRRCAEDADGVEFEEFPPPQSSTAYRRKLPQRGLGRKPNRKPNLNHFKHIFVQLRAGFSAVETISERV